MQATRNYKKLALYSILIWLLACGLCAGLALYLSPANEWMTNFGAMVLPMSSLYWLAIILLWLLQIYVLLPKAQKLMVKNDRLIGLEQTWIWDDKAVAIRNSYIKGTYPFRLFYNWREFPDFIALYLSSQKFTILPKSALDDDQLKDLRAICSREIKTL